MADLLFCGFFKAKQATKHDKIHKIHDFQRSFSTKIHSEKILYYGAQNDYMYILLHSIR